MTVTRQALLAALLIAAAAAAPPRASAQEPVLRALEIAGRGARIGASVTDTEGEDAKTKNGVVVESVTPGGPADKAGMKAGDTITEFDGERVRSVVQFSRLVQETTPGHSVAVAILRGGGRVNVTVAPERRDWTEDFGMRMLDVPRASRAPAPPAPPSIPRSARPEFRYDAPGELRLWNTH
jgi:predicted metalloprotease with PDZ domain